MKEYINEIKSTIEELENGKEVKWIDRNGDTQIVEADYDLQKKEVEKKLKENEETADENKALREMALKNVLKSIENNLKNKNNKRDIRDQKAKYYTQTKINIEKEIESLKEKISKLDLNYTSENTKYGENIKKLQEYNEELKPLEEILIFINEKVNSIKAEYQTEIENINKILNRHPEKEASTNNVFKIANVFNDDDEYDEDINLANEFLKQETSINEKQAVETVIRTAELVKDRIMKDEKTDFGNGYDLAEEIHKDYQQMRDEFIKLSNAKNDPTISVDDCIKNINELSKDIEAKNDFEKLIPKQDKDKDKDQNKDEDKEEVKKLQENLSKQVNKFEVLTENSKESLLQKFGKSGIGKWIKTNIFENVSNTFKRIKYSITERKFKGDNTLYNNVLFYYYGNVKELKDTENEIKNEVIRNIRVKQFKNRYESEYGGAIEGDRWMEERDKLNKLLCGLKDYKDIDSRIQLFLDKEKDNRVKTAVLVNYIALYNREYVNHFKLSNDDKKSKYYGKSNPVVTQTSTKTNDSKSSDGEQR